MDKKTKLVIKGAIALSSILSLSSCNTPGTYFNKNVAASPIKTSTAHYHPLLHIVDAAFYEKTAGDHNPSTSLWYDKHYSYKVGPTDVLNIIVWDHPELSQPTPTSQTAAALTGNMSSIALSQADNSSNGILVDPRGYIFFPYAGRIQVSGLTVEMIRKKLTKALESYIQKPQVSIQVSNFRSQVVQVIGAVNQPGAAPLNDKTIGLLDAIAASGGINQQTADMKHLFIIRGTGLQPDIFQINLKNPSNLLLSEKFKLRPNDIIYVPVAGISNWNTFISQILPTITTYAFTKSLTS